MRRPRICFPNAIYHIYNQGVNKAVIYFDEEDNSYWTKLLEKSVVKFQIKIFCFITMRNHYHCLVQTPLSNISSVMQFVGWKFSFFIKRKYGRVGPLFRNRFQSQIVQSEQYLRAVIQYIHNNPLAAGLAHSLEEETPGIRTSYFHLAGQENSLPWLDKNGLMVLLKIADDNLAFSEFLKTTNNIEEFKVLTRMERIKYGKGVLISEDDGKVKYRMAG